MYSVWSPMIWLPPTLPAHQRTSIRPWKCICMLVNYSMSFLRCPTQNSIIFNCKFESFYRSWRRSQRLIHLAFARPSSPMKMPTIANRSTIHLSPFPYDWPNCWNANFNRCRRPFVIDFRWARTSVVPCYVYVTSRRSSNCIRSFTVWPACIRTITIIINIRYRAIRHCPVNKCRCRKRKNRRKRRTKGQFIIHRSRRARLRRENLRRPPPVPFKRKRWAKSKRASWKTLSNHGCDLLVVTQRCECMLILFCWPTKQFARIFIWVYMHIFFVLFCCCLIFFFFFSLLLVLLLFFVQPKNSLLVHISSVVNSAMFQNDLFSFFFFFSFLGVMISVAKKEISLTRHGQIISDDALISCK